MLHLAARLRTPMKACLTGLLLFVLLSLGLPAAARAHESSYPDVPTSHPAHDAIEYLTGAQVVSGFTSGLFAPDEGVTRAQAAKIIVGQRGVPATSTTTRFWDVDSTYTRFVEAAAVQGWILGYPGGAFRPYHPLQRQHLAVILVRSLGWESEANALSSTEVASLLKDVVDAGSIVSNARGHVALAVSRGLMTGDTSGRFNPGATASRGHLLLASYRAELRGVAVIEGVRFSSDHPDKTRIVLDLTRAPGKVSTSSGAGQLIVNVASAVVPGGGGTTTVGSPEVNSIRATQASYRPPAVRLTLSLGTYSNFDVSAVAPSDGKGHRLVIDVFRRTEGPGEGPPLVCLDAGHGGSDTGAVGVTGLREKDANLAITLEADKFLRQAGVNTILTRTGDTYPSLEERARIANDAKANIFVSIHNNASADPDSKGTETFYQGTPDSYSVEGRRLAEAIQKRLVAALGSKDRGARTHWLSLYVLNHTVMPAALAEVGFLTNAEEEAKLRDPAYRAKAGRAVAEGILLYLGWQL